MIQVVVCGYHCDETLPRCIDSIQMQKGAKFTTTISIDGDKNRKYLLKNTIDTVLGLKPKDDDIIVLVDADDFLCDEYALRTVQEAYDYTGCLLTYGSYVNLSTNQKGKFCGPYNDFDNYRTASWKASHLKTFKYRLFKKVPVECFKEGGEYFKCCADRALMLPMMELAGYNRIKHIPLLSYCYNDTNPISVWGTMKCLSKETRKVLSGRSPLLRMDAI